MMTNVEEKEKADIHPPNFREINLLEKTPEHNINPWLVAEEMKETQKKLQFWIKKK